MSFLEYFHMGFSQGIIIGVPDFTKNSPYTDMENIGHDIRIAMKKATDAKKTDKTHSPKKSCKNTN